MQLVICAVFDSAAQAYNRPFFAPSVGLAVRSFRDEVNRNAPENPMYNHSDDFSLHQLGVFDDANAQLQVAPEIITLARAKDLKE
ncbi:MAG: nonstructural protein [Microvirus sp.]|nr:MAG: nonstructural protein [Microvirus sp.]